VKKVEDNITAPDRIDLSLLNSHTHILTGDIDEENINSAIKWLLYENLDQNKNKTLTLYINSTGGDLYQAFALIDIMNSSHYPVRVIGIGAVMSAAFLIFVSGAKGLRYAAPTTSFMCHQFSSNTEAKYHDIKAEMKENESLNAKMVTILKEASGLATAKIKSKLLPASDVYLSAQEMVDLGLADHILYITQKD